MLGYTKHSPRANRSRSKVQNCPHCTPPGPVIQRWRESFLSLPSIWFVIMQLQVALEMNQWHKVLWEGKNRYRNYESPWQLDLKTGILPVLHKIVMVHTEITLPFACSISISAIIQSWQRSKPRKHWVLKSLTFKVKAPASLLAVSCVGRSPFSVHLGHLALPCTLQIGASGRIPWHSHSRW